MKVCTVVIEYPENFKLEDYNQQVMEVVKHIAGGGDPDIPEIFEFLKSQGVPVNLTMLPPREIESVKTVSPGTDQN